MAEIKGKAHYDIWTQAAVQQQKKGDQNKSHIWFQVHKYRLTSSNFGVVIKRRANFDDHASQLINKQHFSNVHSMPMPLRLGIQHEDIACEVYSAQVGIDT